MTRALGWKASAGRSIALAGLAICMQACFWTSPAPRTAILQSVRGEQAVAHFGREQARGELLALSDSAMVLLSSTNDRVVLVPLTAVWRVEFGVYTTYDARGGAFGTEDREKIRQRSRFPYGLSSEGMAALLRLTGQARPEVLVPRP